MESREQCNKSRLEQVVPSTRFGQALASLFYLKRHKKRDTYGRAPVVSRIRAQSTLLLTSTPSVRTMPFEVLTPMKTSSSPPPPSPLRMSSSK